MDSINLQPFFCYAKMLSFRLTTPSTAEKYGIYGIFFEERCGVVAAND
jgi:hypothetical protein